MEDLAELTLTDAELDTVYGGQDAGFIPICGVMTDQMM